MLKLLGKLYVCLDICVHKYTVERIMLCALKIKRLVHTLSLMNSSFYTYVDTRMLTKLDRNIHCIERYAKI